MTRLFESGKIGKMVLKNRIIMDALNIQLCVKLASLHLKNPLIAGSGPPPTVMRI